MITSLNISLGQEWYLEAALRALQQVNVKIIVLHETKLTRGVYIRYIMGYKVWVTEAKFIHMGAITIVCREEEAWQVEDVASFGTNVVSFTITAG